MKSATNANSATVRFKEKWMNFESYSTRKFFTILALLLLSNLSFAQQKTLNANELQQSLTEVNANIEETEQKIARINSRLAGIPLENIDPQIISRLNDLEIQKDQLEKRKVSIEAALNSIQNSTDPNDSLKTEDSMNSLQDF